MSFLWYLTQLDFRQYVRSKSYRSEIMQLINCSISLRESITAPYPDPLPNDVSSCRSIAWCQISLYLINLYLYSRVPAISFQPIDPGPPCKWSRTSSLDSMYGFLLFIFADWPNRYRKLYLLNHLLLLFLKFLFSSTTTSPVSPLLPRRCSRSSRRHRNPSVRFLTNL